MLRKLAVSLSVLLGALPGAAMAHVVFSEPTAQTGGYYTGFLRVTHGCGGDSPTISVRVTIPDGVVSARPQPKPGWTLKIDKVPLDKPIVAEGGAQITQRVAAVTWTGRLPVDEFDQFGLSLKLGDVHGGLYFPTVQRCEKGENDWTTIPDSPANWHKVDRPAPMLMVGSATMMEHMGH
jgi:hypothetical protein